MHNTAIKINQTYHKLKITSKLNWINVLYLIKLLVDEMINQDGH